MTTQQIRSSIVVAMLGLLMGVANYAHAQEPTVIELEISPQRVPGNMMEYRLLPSEADLKDGNAAVLMLRLIWEQSNWMAQIFPTLREKAELHYSAPELAEIPFDHFYPELKRASRMRTAEWEYPIKEEMLGDILLPDVQGLRQILGPGMKIWIGQKLAEGDVDAAIEGLQIQLSCCRHLTRTPFFVIQLVSIAILKDATHRLEDVVCHPESPNLFYALGLLPDHLDQLNLCAQLEASMLRDFLPSLPSEPLPIGSKQWDNVVLDAAEYLYFYSIFEEPGSGDGQPTITNSLKIIARQLGKTPPPEISRSLIVHASAELEGSHGFTSDEIRQMSHGERVLRWLLARNDKLHQQFEYALSLPVPEALAYVQKMEEDAKAETKRLRERGYEHESGASNTLKPLEIFIRSNQFARQKRQLQIVEALRDHAAKTGTLPASLDEIELILPTDPLTDRPYEYKLEDDVAILSAPKLENVDEETLQSRTYQIKLKK